MNAPDVEFMKNLENERKIAAQGNKTQRVKIKNGESWLVRFLPFPMGKEKTFYARIAQHWLHRKPILCLRNTAPAFGGDPDFQCPICAVAEELYQESPSEAVRDFAYRSQGHPHWRTWCIVMEKDDGRRRESIEGDELYLPYEFELSKTTFDEWSFMLLRDRSKNGGPLDLNTGYDIWASRKNNSIRLDRSEPGPILGITDDEEFNRVIARIWSRCKQPRLTMPTDQQLSDAAERLREAASEEERHPRQNRDDRDQRDFGSDRLARR